jgi:hypothetical protein
MVIIMKIMKNKLKKFLMKYGEYIKMIILGLKKQKVKMDWILFFQNNFQNGAKFFD